MDEELDADFVIEQLERVCTKTKRLRNDIAIVCPFHPDSSPSCSVHTSGHRKKVGTFHCWSCGAKGGWEKLAAQLGLDSGKNYHPDNPFGTKARALAKRLKEEELVRQEMYVNNLPRGSTPWEHGSFRELPESFLVKVEARHWYDDLNACDRIVFPVKNRIGSVVGSAARRLDGEKFKPWMNSSGPWARGALFPLHIVPKSIDRIVLVEGPYDALRLNFRGIPTLAIIGSQNWQPQKAAILRAIGVQTVILCMDGDGAGRTAEAAIYADLKGKFERKKFTLPLNEDPPVDPGNMSQDRIDLLKEYVYADL